MMVVGLWEKERPDSFQEWPGNKNSVTVAESSGRWLLNYAVIGFVATWAVDMAYAPHAAARYNATHRLSPAMEWDSEGMRVGFSIRTFFLKSLIAPQPRTSALRPLS